MFEEIKNEFPVFKKNPELIFLDTAASALKPKKVIDEINNCYSYEYANVHRGLYKLSSNLTDKYEKVRFKVSEYINAKSHENIIFTKSATEGINLVAQTFSEKYLNKNDEIIISYLEHHSNIVPWHIASEKFGFKIIPIKLTDSLEIDLNDFKEKINSKTKLISLTHMSNVIGSITDLNKINEINKKFNVPILIDGCQFVAHAPLNTSELDCDFYVFSGHKLYGPSGVGVLYMKDKWFDNLNPYQGGGSMIEKVEIDKSTFANKYQKFEAGTPPIAEVIGLGASIDFIQDIGLDKILNYENNLHDQAVEKLMKINGLKLYGNSTSKGSIISFNFSNFHPNDIGILLDQKNIAIRTGHHCAQPLMKYLNITSTARASFGIYNNLNDIELLVEGIMEAKNFLK